MFVRPNRCSFFFFFNDTATTEIYTLSLHDALPIWKLSPELPTMMLFAPLPVACAAALPSSKMRFSTSARSEEHTSELQSQSNLVCRLLLEKKKKTLRDLLRRYIVWSRT